ncbi:hypothetical protein [Streptosporangium sp. KLBMP 9127]|nr:hypothetical protein [Streptosporangium sp. KLBMP 9127]
MRWNFRRILAAGAALTMLGIAVPTAAYSEDDPSSCTELLEEDTPAYVYCNWLATPEEARKTAMFWLINDGENLKAAEPLPPVVVDCTDPANTCPEPGGADTTHGEGDGLPEDYEEPEGAPECDPPGTECSKSPTDVEVTAAEVKAATDTADGKAVSAAKAAGMRVWVDTELADDWKAGTEQFTAAVKRVGALAAQPGVTGIRFSSQLGYGATFANAEEITKFVTAASAALRSAAPGKKLAVHTLVPEFGCGTSDACRTEMAKKYPMLAPDQVGSYVTSGAIDQLALDSGLARTEYTPWKISAEKVLRNQWIQVRARAWDAYAHIAAEDAGFAGPTSSQLTAKQATDAIAERISRTLMDDGAETVTLWTRWQDAEGKVYRVLGDKHAANPTWDQLAKLTAVKPRLSTLYNPATPEVDTATDLKKLAEVFSQVYLTSA